MAASMDHGMQDFINDHYDVIYKSDDVEDDFSNVKGFLLCETHTSFLDRNINGFFINTFARPEDTVLLEALPALKQISPEETIQGIRLRKAAARTFMGWDYDYPRNILGERAAGEEFVPLQLEVEILLDDIITASEEEDITEKKILFEEKLKSYKQAIGGKTVGLNAYKKFKERTDAMIDTITQVSDKEGKFFLIAGSMHLSDEIAALLNIHKDLGRFYEEMKSKKVVILRYTRNKEKMMRMLSDSSVSQVTKNIFIQASIQYGMSPEKCREAVLEALKWLPKSD